MCIIEGEKLKELMMKYPSISFKVMDVLSRRLERAENLIENINLNTVEQRLAQALLELAGGNKEISLNMTKGDFASQIGMSQETLSRKLASFQDDGLIELKGQRKILLKNKAGLEDIVSA
jgi:CRP/FNR family transcriptional regulator